MNLRVREPLFIAVLLIGSPAPAQQPAPAKDPHDADSAYLKAAATWREVTARGILPTDFQYLRDEIGWREAVLSYLRDGPGIFNVAPDRDQALSDRALMYVIARDGFEVTQTEVDFIGRLLDQGAREPIKSYAAFIRLRRSAEWMYASDQMMQELQQDDLKPDHRQFLVDALTQIERRLDARLLERKKAEPAAGSYGRNQKAQDRLVQKKLTAIREFLAKQRPAGPDAKPTLDPPKTPDKAPADSPPPAARPRGKTEK
jgi:hypothetical protein